MAVLQIKEQLFGLNSIDVASYLDFLAELYITYGNYTKASTILNRALEIKKNQLDVKSASTAKTYSLLADLTRKQGQYQQAQELFQKTLEILESVFRKDDPVIAIVYNNFALTFRQQAKGGDKTDPNLVNADQLYMKALTILERNYGEQHSLGTSNIS